KLGGNISSSSINQGFAAVEYNHLGTYAKFLSANIYYGRLYSSVKLNGRIDLPGRMPFALTTSFTMNRWDYYNSSPDPFFEDVRPSYLINNERNVKVELSTPVKYNGVVKIGYSRSKTKNSYYQIKSFNKADTADITYFDADNLSLKLEKNTLNRKQYPTKGEYNLIKFNYIKGYEDFVSGSTSNLEDFNNSLHYWLNLELVHDKYFNLGNHFTLGYLAKAVISNKSFFGNYTSTILSSQAFTPTPHSKTLFIENLRLNNYLALGIKPIININSLIDLRFEMYGYLPYKKIISVNNGIAEYDKEFSDYSYLMSSSLVFNTIVGPASFSVNYYEKDDKNLYFIFNFGYIIFNKKGI
ncbi:MAG: hypothetical protein U9R54_06725, partial [Bacteroidota bacterium]|nr:hypothetical protein [Bacteroidota bacterium]